MTTSSEVSTAVAALVFASPAVGRATRLVRSWRDHRDEAGERHRQHRHVESST